MDTLCHIRLFGVLQFRRGDYVAERFSTYPTRLLLARLAFAPGRACHRDELCDLLWPDADMDTARVRLRTALASLRRQIEPPAGDALGTGILPLLSADRSHVRLRPEAVIADAAEFQKAVRKADAAPPGPERADLLASAFALYTGELLPDYDESWVVGERERLAGLYEVTALHLIGAREAAGDILGAIATARETITASPLMEAAHGSLIRLLIAAGQTEAARGQFQALERTLRDELGDAPLPATRALLNGVPDPRYQAAMTESARIVPPAAVSPEDPAPVLPPFSPLPQPLTRFFGREAEIERLGRLTIGEGERLVTITGPGGTGKTRLALEFARRRGDAWPGAVGFVSLAGLTDGVRFYEAVAEALRLPRRAAGEPGEQIRAALNGCPVLLLLDNFEQVAEAAGPDVERLLSSLPLLTCLATSRRRLEVPGERELVLSTLPVPPAPLAGDAALSPAQAALFPGVQLFVDRAQSALPDFALSPRNAAAISGLCTRLDGMPLALELAAAWARMLTPAQMHARLDDKFPLLVSRRKGVPERHSSLWAALDGSYRQLSPPLQVLFARLSVFRGGWTEEAAAQVCEHPAALAALDELRVCSLLTTREDGEALRCGMLETLREFGREHLTPDQSAALSRRHAEYFHAFVERGMDEIKGADHERWLARLKADHDNIRAALAWTSEADPALALEIVGTLWRFWIVVGALQEGHDWYARILARSPNTPTPARLQALIGYANLAFALGELSFAQSVLEDCLPVCAHLQERSGRACVLSSLATIADRRGDFASACAHGAEGLALYRAEGARHSIATGLNNLGVFTRHAGDLAASQQHLQAGLAMARADENLLVVGMALGNLGLTLQACGDLARARSHHLEALDIQRRLSDKNGMATSLGGLAMVDRERGDYEGARAHLRECLLIREATGDKMKVPLSLGQAAHLAAALGLAGQAVTMFGAEAALREAHGQPRSPSEASDAERALGGLRACMGKEAFARHWAAGNALDWRKAIRFALEQVVGPESPVLPPLP